MTSLASIEIALSLGLDNYTVCFSADFCIFFHGNDCRGAEGALWEGSLLSESRPSLDSPTDTTHQEQFDPTGDPEDKITIIMPIITIWVHVVPNRSGRLSAVYNCFWFPRVFASDTSVITGGGMTCIRRVIYTRLAWCIKYSICYLIPDVRITFAVTREARGLPVRRCLPVPKPWSIKSHVVSSHCKLILGLCFSRSSQSVSIILSWGMSYHVYCHMMFYQVNNLVYT